jgi:hypothetical protein
MFGNLAFSDDYARERIAEILREAENDHLADLARVPGRPIRSRIADWLVVVAEWVEGRPQASSTMRAEV